MVSEVSADTVLPREENSPFISVPVVGSYTDESRCGVTSSPPFTTDAAAASIPIGVTATACPKPMRARSTDFTALSLMNIPEVSPVMSTPVFPRSPNASR